MRSWSGWVICDTPGFVSGTKETGLEGHLGESRALESDRLELGIWTNDFTSHPYAEDKGRVDTSRVLRVIEQAHYCRMPCAEWVPKSRAQSQDQ